MSDFEKVIKGLEQHINTGCMSEREQLQPVICPYFQNSHCIIALCRDALELLKSRQPRLLTVEEINALPEGAVCWEEFRDEDGVINNDLTPAMKWGLLSLVNGEADVTCLNAYGTQGYGSGQARSRWWSAKPTDEQRKAVAWE